MKPIFVFLLFYSYSTNALLVAKTWTPPSSHALESHFHGDSLISQMIGGYLKDASNYLENNGENTYLAKRDVQNNDVINLMELNKEINDYLNEFRNNDAEMEKRDRRRSARFVLTSPRTPGDEFTSLQFKIWKLGNALKKIQKKNLFRSEHMNPNFTN